MVVLREEKKTLSMPLLKQYMAEDKELKRILTTPVAELNEQYLNLFPPENEDYWRGASIMDILRIYTNMEGYGVHNYLSFSKDEPIGWISYRTEGDVVAEINVIAFYLDRPNVSLIRDLHLLINDLLKDYSEVRYQSLDGNPVRGAYDKFAKMHNCTPVFANGMWNYSLREATTASSFAGNVPLNCVGAPTSLELSAEEDLEELKGRKITEKVYTSGLTNPPWEEVSSWKDNPQGFVDWLNENISNRELMNEFGWIPRNGFKDFDGLVAKRKIDRFTKFLSEKDAFLTLMDAHASWDALYLHRVINLFDDGVETLDEGEMGCSWAWDEEGMLNFSIENGGMAWDTREDLVCEMTAETPIDNVHWALSLLCLLTFGNEHEARIIDDSKVRLVRKEFYTYDELCYNFSGMEELG